MSFLTKSQRWGQIAPLERRVDLSICKKHRSAGFVPAYSGSLYWGKIQEPLLVNGAASPGRCMHRGGRRPMTTMANILQDDAWILESMRAVLCWAFCGDARMVFSNVHICRGCQKRGSGREVLSYLDPKNQHCLETWDIRHLLNDTQDTANNFSCTPLWYFLITE